MPLTRRASKQDIATLSQNLKRFNANILKAGIMKR
jgi:hypothetical protein